MKKRIIVILILLAAVLIVLGVVSCHPIEKMNDLVNAKRSQPTEAVLTEQTEPAPTSHMIPDAASYVIPQDVLKAGCETHACTMLMNILGFDLDEITFANNYLDCHYVYKDEESGYMEGPDMYSAFAGTAYSGWGVYAPSMAKSMNRYLADQKSQLKAYNYENIPLEQLCEEYTVNDIPVMIWATTDMQEPYVFDTWTVNYVDENAKTQLGDEFKWYAHEHCLVLVGYDEDEYFFCDSSAGEVTHFKKDLVAERYAQLGSQCIVVK